MTDNTTIFNLPNQAKVDRFIAKKTFESKIANGKAIFENIEKITWLYKLSSSTINIPSNKTIEEIHIFQVLLKEKAIPKKALENIKKLIPYPILFCLKFQEQTLYAISLQNELRYYYSDWDEEILFDFGGTSLEKVYENIIKKFLKQIDSLDTKTTNFKDSIKLNDRVKNLKQQIQTYQNKISKEKQFKKQLELKRGLKPLQKELETILKDTDEPN